MSESAYWKYSLVMFLACNTLFGINNSQQKKKC